MTKRDILPLLLAGAFALSGCGNTGAPADGSLPTSGGTTDAAQTGPAVSSSELFTDRDMEIGYDEETSVRIFLLGDTASCDSDAVQITGSTITITDEGTFVLSGVLDDGMIVLDAENTDQIQLVLENASVTSSASAAVYVAQADKVFITTAAGSDNLLANGGEYAAVDDGIDAALFSKPDLTLNGAGTLTVSAAAGHGIVSGNDLALTSGTYTITAAGHGLFGKDSVRISGGTYTITSGRDGLHAENADESSLGFIYITGGSFTMQTDGSVISAGTTLQIEGGTFSITAGKGSANSTLY